MPEHPQKRKSATPADTLKPSARTLAKSNQKDKGPLQKGPRFAK